MDSTRITRFKRLANNILNNLPSQGPEKQARWGIMSKNGPFRGQGKWILDTAVVCNGDDNENWVLCILKASLICTPFIIVDWVDDDNTTKYTHRKSHTHQGTDIDLTEHCHCHHPSINLDQCFSWWWRWSWFCWYWTWTWSTQNTNDSYLLSMVQKDVNLVVFSHSTKTQTIHENITPGTFTTEREKGQQNKPKQDRNRMDLQKCGFKIYYY